MQAQINKSHRTSSYSSSINNPVQLYQFIGKLIFDASVASMFGPAAAEDPDLYAAFLAFDQHLPMALGGYKVRTVLWCKCIIQHEKYCLHCEQILFVFVI